MTRFVCLFTAIVCSGALAIESGASEPPPRARMKNWTPTPEELQAAYQRSGRAEQASHTAFKECITPHWFGDAAKFWYRNDLRSGTREFVLVDAATGQRVPAFDHARLAAAFSQVSGTSCAADRLPFDAIEFTEREQAVRFNLGGSVWTCSLATYSFSRSGPESRSAQLASIEPPHSPPQPDDDAEQAPWTGGAPEPAPQLRRQNNPDRAARSPDEKWTTIIKDHNVFLRGADGMETQLSRDGKDGLAYGLLEWSPDSKTLVAFRIDPGERKEVFLVESSPKGGGRAKLHTRLYPLPGDKFIAYELHLFDVPGQKEIKTDLEKIDFGFPRLRWNRDSGSFTCTKIDRGHQRFRLIEVDARTGKCRNLIDEKSATFVWTAHTEGLNLGTVNWLEKTDEILHVSERDGWRHLYLVDARLGTIKNQVTKGEYVLRGIDRIDEANRQVWFRASGKNPDQDPYFIHYYRINFDGTGLVALTEGNGTHSIQFSPNRDYLIDTYSRVDQAPVHELRRVASGELVCKLEEADIADLQASGWRAPEVFVAKGRDGTTDIWGIICRPRQFDPTKKYPVIEQIYAGPQGSFTPKAFAAQSRFAALTELGFIVVQMDGMGTANRSKAFHDVCWKNLKDAGFPDRILWHRAVAAKYPWYDVSRVGIYGGSAGGQNSTGAVLFHPEFYKVAVSSCGCHDNRMDKSSWNEQWMGYPVGPQYAASSNIDNAHRLRGKLLLLVGEMDTNVPPESTLRLADALIKAGKDFELLVLPGMGHGDGGNYGQRRRQDFFVRHLHGVETPDRNGAMR